MMICKIVHNEGITHIFLVIFIIGANCSYLSSREQSIQDLCSSNRYLYTVRPEEPQKLKLTYNTKSEEINKNKWYQKSKQKCRKEFKTNNGASHFVIILSNMSIPSCSEKCGCNYFVISEPGNSVKFCGEPKEPIYFETKSDYFSIEFQHGLSMNFEVTLEFTVERNTYIITGLPKEDPFHAGHFIETPYFPNTYQSDYTSEYFFHTDDEDGRVMLLFYDFLIAPSSFIEVVGHNGTIQERIFGNVLRPPVFVSESNEMTLKFEANRQLGNSGFRVLSYFLKSADVLVVKPYTDCGGSFIGYGGSINLEKQEDHLYDCLWLINTPFFPQANNLFLTVANISLMNIGPKASLEFREGQNSKSNIVKSIDCMNFNCSYIPFEITVSPYNGLYVRFTGYLSSLSFLGMVYSTYSIGNCSSQQFHCQGRCLPLNLICDGSVQCPDGSDELECTRTTEIEDIQPTVEVKKYSSSAKVGAAFNVILSFGVCGLLFVIGAICIIVLKGVKTVPPIDQSEHPVIISEMSGPLTRTYSTNSNSDVLPSYEDFIQASDRYPPLLYTRATKRNSAPFIIPHKYIHTTSFCEGDNVKPQTLSVIPMINEDYVPMMNNSISVESILAREPSISPQPSCSYERNNFAYTMKKVGKKTSSLPLQRAWCSVSKLDELNKNDCHLHLSITHCAFPNCCECSQKQYYSLPINLKINGCENDIDIIFQKNSVAKIDFSKSRHLSFCYDSNAHHSKVLTIKTRCQSDPCQFSVHCSLR